MTRPKDPTRQGREHRYSHGYRCICEACKPRTGAAVCQCDRPGPTDEDRCAKCGRSARPTLRAAA